MSALGKIGAAPGLPTLKSAMKDNDNSVRRAAIKSVAEYWPTAEPILQLRDASRSDSDEACRVTGTARIRANARPSEQTPHAGKLSNFTVKHWTWRKESRKSGP